MVDYFYIFYHHVNMYRSSRFDNSSIPDEYRKIAENLFPPEGFSEKKSPSLNAAAEFAGVLGIGNEHKRLLNLIKTSGQEMGDFLEHFQNNLDLLIQKTWVEKSEESRKEKLQNEVPGFVDGIENKNFHQALDEFGAILDELAYLFFGSQSMGEDFTEYTFRIDAQMGLFWWYGSQIGCLREAMAADGVGEYAAAGDSSSAEESLWAVLLIGICFLTNF